MQRLLLITAAVALGLSQTAAAATGPVEGRLVRLGLFAGPDPVIRSGAWCMVEVELRYRGTTPLDGKLSVEQSDNDGDVVTSVEPVALAPGGDWRAYQVCFVPAQVSQASPIAVKLLDAQDEQLPLVSDTGEEITELYAPPAAEIPPDEMLVVDLSSPRRLPHLTALDEDQRRQHDDLNARTVRAMAPRELPLRPQALDAVDAIVWDDADPSQLSRPQIDALVDWTRAGGRLLITAGRNWQSLASSPLAEWLPVKIGGVIHRSEALEFLDIVENDTYAGLLDRHYAKNLLLRCQMSPLAGSIPVPSECPHQQICWRRFLGRGVVTFVGASFRELLPPPGGLEESIDEATGEFKKTEPTRLFLEIGCEKVIARRMLALPAVQKQEYSVLMATPTDLFQILRGSIAFESVGTQFLIFAVLFAIAYSLVATVGSHVFLKRRGWLQHSWSVFGIVSLAGCFVGLGVVGVLRGVTTKLWKTTIVDLHAAEPNAEAFCLLGVKTPNHVRADLRLPRPAAGPGDAPSGQLRGVPGAAASEVMEARFAASSNYETVRAGELLKNVPIRATLKEFVGRWSGPLDGRVDGKIVTRKGADPKDTLEYEFAPGSYLHNRLGVELRDCYLVMTRSEVAGEALLDLSHCFYVGHLPADGPGARLSDVDLRRQLLYQANVNQPDKPAERIPRLPLLKDAMRNWADQLRSLRFLNRDPDLPPLKITGDQEYVSVLMLSFFDLIRLDGEKPADFKRSHGRPLSCTDELTKRTALLIGHSGGAGPATLHFDGRALRPSKSLTIYRVVLPVERQ